MDEISSLMRATKNESIDPDEDLFYEVQQSPAALVKLSHMNNKSSVLCPESQTITSQYLALQQLDAHQRMISRAKGCVDTSPPKSLQSYISVADRRKKKLRRQLHNESWPTGINEPFDEHNRPSSSRMNTSRSEEEDNLSLNTSSVNKGIQAGIPYATYTSNTADKISWYLEALNQGQLDAYPFMLMDHSRNISKQFGNVALMNKKQKREVKGDVMDWHKEYFIKQRKPFYPRILADNDAKSKIKTMRCYNPSCRKKNNSSSHSSDTFESYEEEDDTDDELKSLKMHDNTSVEEETEMSKNMPKDTFKASLHSLHSNGKYSDSCSTSEILNRNEEDKYLNFLSKVTEDVLRSGIYSDRAIRQAFEFHMQFYQEDPSKDKLQLLLSQVLEGLKISNDDSDDMLHRKKISFPLSRTNTPPEKESSDASLMTNEGLRIQKDLSILQGEDVYLNIHSKNQTCINDFQNGQNVAQDNFLGLKLNQS